MSDWLDIIQAAEASRDAAVAELETVKTSYEKVAETLKGALSTLGDQLVRLEKENKTLKARMASLETVVMHPTASPPSLTKKLDQLLGVLDGQLELASRHAKRLDDLEVITEHLSVLKDPDAPADSKPHDPKTAEQLNRRVDQLVDTVAQEIRMLRGRVERRDDAWDAKWAAVQRAFAGLK